MLTRARPWPTKGDPAGYTFSSSGIALPSPAAARVHGGEVKGMAPTLRGAIGLGRHNRGQRWALGGRPRRRAEETSASTRSGSPEQRDSSRAWRHQCDTAAGRRRAPRREILGLAGDGSRRPRAWNDDD